MHHRIHTIDWSHGRSRLLLHGHIEVLRCQGHSLASHLRVSPRGIWGEGWGRHMNWVARNLSLIFWTTRNMLVLINKDHEFAFQHGFFPSNIDEFHKQAQTKQHGSLRSIEPKQNIGLQPRTTSGRRTSRPRTSPGPPSPLHPFLRQVGP